MNELAKTIVISKKEYNELRCKVRRYERFLHYLQLYAQVSVNQLAVARLIKNACDWSYAHRVGNGQMSDEDQKKSIFRAFQGLVKSK